MDKIFVRGLLCELRIGVEAPERRYPQVCKVDLEMTLDLQRAVSSDSVRDTVDYAGLCREILEVASGRQYHLVEAFAGTVADVALRHEAVQEVRVYVEKTPLSLQGVLDSVGVEIVRKRWSRV